MRIVALGVSCLIVMSVLLASCVPAATPTSSPTLTPTPPLTQTPTATPTATGEPRYGGTFRVISMYTDREPTSWDPADLSWLISIYAGPYLETLLEGDLSRGPGGTNEFNFSTAVGVPDALVIGNLATNWEQPDPLTIIFHIRHGVMWQGKKGVMEARELTASDVAFSFNRMLASPKVSKAYTDFIGSVTAPDKYTVVFSLKEFQGIWKNRIGYYYPTLVYPPELVKAGIQEWRNAVGTGPFMLKDYVQAASVTYEKNPNYWNTTTINGKEYRLPFVDRLEALLIMDESTRLAALRTAKCDLAEVVSFKYKETLAQTNPELLRLRILYDTDLLVGMRTDTPPFGDIKVRRALSMAIDRQALTKTIYGGEAEILSFPYPSTWPETLYTPLEKLDKSVQDQFGYNPERSKQLLADAGYPNGFQTEMIVRPSEIDMASVIVSYWKNVGIDCKLETRDPTTHLSIMSNHGHKQMMLFGKSVGCAFEPILSTAVAPPATYNVSMVDDPYLNALYKKALGTADETERERLCKEMFGYFHQQCFYIVLPNPYVYRYFWPWVKNYHGENNVRSSTAGPVYARIWLDLNLKEKITK